jgi:leader peptidase (prepilin peptidase)/N-methyltransferase
MVELLTGLLFVAARATHGTSVGLYVRDFPLIAILVAVTFIDLDHRIIPNVLSIPGAAFGLVTSFLDSRLGFEPLTTFGLVSPPSSEILTAVVRSTEGIFLGYALFYGLARSYELATGRAGLGGGDVKLLTLIGAFLGPMGVIITIFVSSILGSVVGIAWALMTRRKNLLSAAIPYGPFLVVGSLYYYLFY